MRTHWTPHGSTLGRRAALATLLAAPFAGALGRKPYGGALRLAVPFAITALDPHDVDDPVSALFAPAVFDTLFALDGEGRPFPTLSQGMPEALPDGARVRLRAGLTTSSGTGLDGRDLVASFVRSREGGGRALLGHFGPPKIDAHDPLAVVVPGADPKRLAEALSSGTTALVPRRFSPDKPQGTGAFRATLGSTLLLERNERAARGPAFLDRIEVRAEPDLAGLLRNFEIGELDVGFLGAGLHRPRDGAISLSTPPVGYVLLSSGAQSGSWGAPGVAQELVESIDPKRLSHLGLRPSNGAQKTTLWGGPKADILVDQASAYLVEVAREVAASLSRPGHELSVLPLTRNALKERLLSRTFALAVRFARQLGPSPEHVALGLLQAVDPRLTDAPPRNPSRDPRVLARSLPLGIIGALSMTGATTPAFSGLPSWDLGSVFAVKSA